MYRIIHKLHLRLPIYAYFVWHSTANYWTCPQNVIRNISLIVNDSLTDEIINEAPICNPSLISNETEPHAIEYVLRTSMNFRFDWNRRSKYEIIIGAPI